MVTLPNPTLNTGGVSAGGSASAGQSMLGNYDLFLTLLTTQIQNQDPLEPLDSSEYTNQLVQYSSVEQSIQTNDYLQQLVASMESAQATSYFSYIGSQVTASGDTSSLTGGRASWDYTVGQDATGTVEVINAQGKVVYSDQISASAGAGSFVWDGKNSSGGQEPDGSYKINFKLANSGGSAVPASVEISGVVDGVDLTTGTPFLEIGTAKVPVSAVKSVRSIN